MRSFIMTLCGAAAFVAWGTGSAQTTPNTEYEYFRWTECTQGYAGALTWDGYPFANPEEAARYPQTGLHNVHVHVLKSRADVERDGRQAHNAAVRLCAAKIALFSRVSDEDRALFDGAEMPERVRQSLNPTDTGHIILFDDQDRMIGISDVQDMRQVAAFYVQYLRNQRTQE